MPFPGPFTEEYDGCLSDHAVISAGGMHHPENRIRPHEIPRINRGAVLAGVALQSLGIDRLNSAIHSGGSPAVQELLVDVDALVEFSGGSRGRRAGHAGPGTTGDAVPGCDRRWIERPVVGNVVISSSAPRRAAAHQRRQPGE